MAEDNAVSSIKLNFRFWEATMDCVQRLSPALR